MTVRILIVDDDKTKVARLRRALDAHPRASQLKTDVAETSQEARRFLGKHCYDLLLLDQNLPRRAGEAPEVREGLEILSEIESDTDLKRPSHILILSLYPPGIENGLRADQLGWGFLTYGSRDENWKRPLESKIEYIFRQNTASEGVSANTFDFDYDVAVVTALQDPEWTHMQEWDVDWESHFVAADFREYFVGKKTIGGRTFRLVGMPIQRMGMVAAATATSSLIRNFRPRLVVMGGIAAGVVKEQKLGDIVIGTHAWNYDAGKVIEEGTAVRYLSEPDQIDVDKVFLAKLQSLCHSKAVKRRLLDHRRRRRVEWKKVWLGPIATGSAVVEAPAVVQRVVSQNRKATAIEMEVYGVYAACDQAVKPVPAFFAAKAVSDFAVPGREEKDRRKAARNSAAFLEFMVTELLRMGW